MFYVVKAIKRIAEHLVNGNDRLLVVLEAGGYALVAWFGVI